MQNTQRILLISCTGQVGAELWRGLQPLGQVIPADREYTALSIDLANHSLVRDLVREVRPNVIVNAAAYTAVDKAEQDSALAMAINGTAPGVLAEEAKALGALLVHYSTDYVFDGQQRNPYTETDACNPQSVGCHHLIFRTSWVYGRYGQNFLLTMQRLAQERDELRIVADQIGAPTWSRLIADATTQVLAQLKSPLFAADIAALSGIYNLTCAGQTSWFEFARAILRQSVNPPKVLPITTSEYPAPAKRPAYSVLSNAKLARTFGVQLPAWDNALAVCLSRGVYVAKAH